MTESHLKALRIIAGNPRLSQRDIAKELNLSLGKVNYIINALIKEGYIKMDRFRNSDNRLSYMYVLTSEGMEKRIELTRKFIKKKSENYRMLSEEIKELQEEMKAFNL